MYTEIGREDNIELIDLVDMYIYLQLHNPLVIDEAEPKLYPKEAVEYYVKECNANEGDLQQLCNVLEKRKNDSLSRDMSYKPIYSRTEFFSKCFHVLTENYSVDEIKEIVNKLKFNYLKEENYKYAEFAIDKISSKSLSNRKVLKYVKTMNKKRI